MTERQVALLGRQGAAAAPAWRSALELGGPNLRAATRGPRRLGLAVVLLFFGVGSAWSTLASLTSATLAFGVVIPEGSRQTVQHLEGGIIREIHVRDGSAVQEGDPLVTLEDTMARAEHESLMSGYLALLATEARLVAERLTRDTIGFPQELLTRSGNYPEALRSMHSQEELFVSRREARRGRKRVLAQRIVQLKLENRISEEVTAAHNERLRLLEAEIADVEKLLERGFTPKPRLIALQRERAEVMAERAENLTRIASNERVARETELEIASRRLEDNEAINVELSEVRTQLARVRSELPSARDTLARTVVRAPTAGTVVAARFTTLGGVIQPGEPLLDIVPSEERLLIDARVQPHDIESVAVGLEARVVLSAYGQRNLPQIHGVVRSVSADRLVDERTGAPYFLVRVEVPPDELKRITDLTSVDVALVAGMPAEMMIVTGKRTVVDYLLKPFTDSLRRSFKEN